jgi:hypothetical protein
MPPAIIKAILLCVKKHATSERAFVTSYLRDDAALAVYTSPEVTRHYEWRKNKGYFKHGTGTRYIRDGFGSVIGLSAAGLDALTSADLCP